jgi:hypothetical protein
MESLDLSKEAYTNSRKYGMADVRYLIYADLRAVGWSKTDAWKIVFRDSSDKWLKWTKEKLEAEMKRLESLESVQKRIKEARGKDEELTPEELAKEVSKEKILTDLVLSRRKQRQGSKEWQDTTKMIAEYAKIKQDDIQVEDTTVHFYLPANYPKSCYECMLFKNGIAEIQETKRTEDDNPPCE